MSAKNHTRLSPRQRLSRGLTYTAVGPVDVTRGIVGLGASPEGGTPEDLGAFIARETARWKRVVAIAGVKLE